jgi:hypothetical protein
MSQVIFTVQLRRGRGRTGEKMSVTFAPQVDVDATARFRRLSEPVLQSAVEEAKKGK